MMCVMVPASREVVRSHSGIRGNDAHLKAETISHLNHLNFST